MKDNSQIREGTLVKFKKDRKYFTGIVVGRHMSGDSYCIYVPSDYPGHSGFGQIIRVLDDVKIIKKPEWDMKLVFIPLDHLKLVQTELNYEIY